MEITTMCIYYIYIYISEMREKRLPVAASLFISFFHFFFPLFPLFLYTDSMPKMADPLDSPPISMAITSLAFLLPFLISLCALEHRRELSSGKSPESFLFLTLLFASIKFLEWLSCEISLLHHCAVLMASVYVYIYFT